MVVSSPFGVQDGHAIGHASNKGFQKVLERASKEVSQKGSQKVSCCRFCSEKEGFSEEVLRRGDFQKMLRTLFWRARPSRGVPCLSPCVLLCRTGPNQSSAVEDRLVLLLQ